MKRYIALVILVMPMVIAAAAADDERKLTFGNITIDKVYNQANHRVLLVSPEGERKLVASGAERELAACFMVAERVDPKAITQEAIERSYYLADKGKHTFFFTHTPDGFKVHRVRDKGVPTRGRMLKPVDTKDRTFDLLLQHLASKTTSKTLAFKLVPAGELKDKYEAGTAGRRSSSLLRRVSSASVSSRARSGSSE